MSDIVEEAKKIVALRGDTYSSYEVVGLVGRFADEIERLRSLLKAEKTTLELRWQDVERLEADNERLRALIEDALDDEVAVRLMPKWCDEARRALERVLEEK